MIEEIKLITETRAGNLVRVPATVKYEDGRIFFIKSPFALKDEIKAMRGSKWHGFEDPKTKYWSVLDCQRNRFQLEYLKGGNPYDWFDRKLNQHEYSRPLRLHQCDLSDHGLTYHYQIWAAGMGTGKTLSAISVMEMSGKKNWFWVGPEKSIHAIKREFRKWSFAGVNVELMTYERLVRIMNDWPADQPPPEGVIFDEASKLKNWESQRSQAAQSLADSIRRQYGFDGYAILMTGTPSPKTPVDWWALAEIAFPGFLKEGSAKALEARLAFMVNKQFDSGIIKQRAGWRDDENKCNECGKFLDAGHHNNSDFYLDYDGEDEAHDYVPSTNEVALMNERLNGLVVVKHKKDCLDLPDKQYRKVYCKPNKSTLRVAQALMGTSPNAMQAATLLRELSDGFQYREEKDGTSPCTHCNATGEVAEWFDPEDEERTYASVDMFSADVVASLQKRQIACPRCGGSKEMTKYKRITREIPTPKQDVLVSLLEEMEEHGRIVIFGGFTGSVDRCMGICLKEHWDVVLCDGRGFKVFQVQSDGEILPLPREDALEYWCNREHQRVAFVAHPESGGMAFTLTEACMAVFWSNTYKPEYRGQAEDRIHRPGMDENLGATIVDIFHLPSDEHVLNVIRENRRLELMTMGELTHCLENAETSEDGEVVETVEQVKAA